ncbi:PREDICTED: uncharacterized protein LOC104604116 isoform X2 [Nelumbo nucifera]|nr:PREDICTED: uncharacterized protein LOC104604116 isoform X2 [Nelumbo nucifera]
MGFCNFPIAGNLLTYLYTQLRDADPVHRPLLKFLFLRSCEPYCGFIKSWIYQAKISDPYKEFLVEYVDDSPPYSCGKAGFLNDLPLASIKERVGVAIPCFLRDFCLPLIRAGQQLQVLILLLELCNSMISGNHTYEEILPCWSILSNDHLSYSTPLMFNKRDIEDMVLARNDMYRKMQDKAQHILTRLRTRYPKISCSALPYGKLPSPFNNCTEILHVPIPFASDERAVDGEDSEASSTTDEFSYAADPLEFSECSSLNSFDEKNDAEEPDDLHGSLIGLQTRFLSSSVLFTGFSVENLSQKQPETVKSHTFDCTSNKTFRPDNHLVNKLQELKLNHISVPLHPSTPTWSKMSDIQSEDYQYDMYWPLGGLSRNPFNVDTDFNFETPPHVTDSNLKVSNQSAEVLKGGSSYFGEMFPRNSALEQAAGKVQFENGNGAASNSFIFPSLESKCINTVLDINPMLTKNKWFHMMGMSGNRSFMDNNKYLSFFEFSSVEDPVKVNGERLLAGQNHEYQSENLSPYSVSAERGMVESEEEKHHDRGYIMADQEKLSDDCLPLESKENQQEEYPSADVSGGAKWENSLSYSGKGLIHGARGHKECLASTVEIPVDVIIDKCMLQEILLQYRYVSSLTIKLLEEGFDLQEHLLALRRYHFMELADWADLFIMSLWHHKWNVAEANQGIPVIQGFLNLAVQRSSCERDNYKDRLFVYTRGHGMMPISSSSIGIHSFDFIALGYKVDWPVNIVLTPGALRIYADIFSFLIQVKLAVFSLTDIWCFLKDFVHLISRIRGSGLHDQDMGYFNIIVKMRHQVNHFVSTLQQYVQSQLSQVSWCKFLHSLKHQVKDMLDLEVVHMTYLASSLNICFLSDETRPVASIIESILQCALDFRSCFIGNVRNVGLDQGDLAGLLAQINFTQVLAIKATFEKNLKDLYLCYLKSPKHGDFGLCRFWGYLNYNDYYSNIFGDGIIHFAP